jgi:hypothetical protein
MTPSPTEAAAVAALDLLRGILTRGPYTVERLAEGREALALVTAHMEAGMRMVETCVKCGSSDLQRKWCPGNIVHGRRWYEMHGTGSCPVGEHHDCYCRGCTWEWTEPVRALLPVVTPEGRDG